MGRQSLFFLMQGQVRGSWAISRELVQGPPELSQEWELWVKGPMSAPIGFNLGGAIQALSQGCAVTLLVQGSPWQLLHVAECTLQRCQAVTLLSNQVPIHRMGSFTGQGQAQGPGYIPLDHPSSYPSWMNSSRAAHSDTSWGRPLLSTTKDRMGSRSSAPLQGAQRVDLSKSGVGAQAEAQVPSGRKVEGQSTVS